MRSVTAWLCLGIIFWVPTETFAQSAAGAGCEGWIAIDSGSVTGATILLDGQSVEPRTPATLKGIPCGSHTVEVTRDNYIGARSTLSVQAGEVAKVSLELRPNFGGLAVTSEPTGAQVELDGNPAGQTPLALPVVGAGEHEVKIVLPDHETIVHKVKVEIGKKASVAGKLVPLFGRLEVTARAEGEAMVWLDGDPLGPAPLELDRIPAGAHTVRVTASLYQPFEQGVSVTRGQTTRVTAVPRPDFGTLALDSVPPGARLRVDGKDVGNAPLVLPLSAGEHQVEAVGDPISHQPASTRVKLKVGARQTLTLKLSVKTGSLMIDTIPFAARVELDGKPRGKAPLSLKDVPVGAHALMAKAEGLPPLAGRIEVVADQTSVAEMNLREPNRSVFRTPETAARPELVAAPEVVARPEPTPAASPAPEKKAVAAKAPPAAPSVQGKIEPTPAPADALPTAGEPEARTDVSARAAAPMSTRRLLAWISGGVAVASGITAVALFGAGVATEQDADEAYDTWRANPTAANEQHYQDLDAKYARLYTVGWVMTGLTAAFGVASAVLFITEPPPEIDRTGPSEGLRAAPLPGGGWVGYQGRF